MGKIGLGCIAVLVIVVLVVGLSFAGTYNRLVTLGQEVDKQWSQVENQYQRRMDLIPNLVSTVQGAANFEKSTLEAVVNARASVGRATINPGSAPTDPAQLAQYEQAQASLGAALQRLLVVVERYPELKANANFRDLQAQLEGTENRIAVAADGLQQVSSGLQHRAPALPDQPDRGDARIQGEGVLQGDGRRRAGPGGAVQLLQYPGRSRAREMTGGGRR